MKKILLLFVTLLFLFYIQSSYAGCGICNGISVCGTDYCCGVVDDVCPEEFGDWEAAGCTENGAALCDTPDRDCCWREECDYTNPELPDCDGVCEASSCYDGVDNDRDGPLDFCGNNMTNDACVVPYSDSDCQGTIYGYVYNRSNGMPLSGVHVRAVQKQPLEYLGGSYLRTFSDSTNESGGFSIQVDGDVGGGRSYDIIAGKEQYKPESAYDLVIGFQERFQVDFTLEESFSDCSDDCTKKDTICHSECNFWNNCYFNDPRAQDACDGKQPGFKAIYAENTVISCCEGSPYVKPKPLVGVGKTIVVQKLDFVRLIKAIILDGETINLVIDVFENVVE
ncbi:hypothetical protein HQ529_01485 [Candidatus Woesearchaeota archaeon]|nr:hypothetical protein [Candidatus Woesearchaeota archaeon]